VLSGRCYAQSKPAEPIPTTPCELLQAPDRFNGRIVRVRGPVRIAFEYFELAAGDCAGRKIDQIWLEYGRGPKRQPTTWCCGDMVPRDRLALRQDAEFRKFDRYLTAGTNVTATLTARFDAGKPEPCRGDAERHCCMFTGGFGHFGAACSRLVIQSVADVVAEPVPQASGYRAIWERKLPREIRGLDDHAAVDENGDLWIVSGDPDGLAWNGRLVRVGADGIVASEREIHLSFPQPPGVTGGPIPIPACATWWTERHRSRFSNIRWPCGSNSIPKKSRRSAGR